MPKPTINGKPLEWGNRAQIEYIRSGPVKHDHTFNIDVTLFGRGFQFRTVVKAHDKVAFNDEEAKKKTEFKIINKMRSELRKYGLTITVNESKIEEGKK